MGVRAILHCDCNSFFASVETVLNPSFASVPMAVCGSVEDRHGIVLAKNELAKKFGIVTAETVYSAKKKCPGLVIAEPHYEEYIKFSKLVNDIYCEYTDLVEPFGIDESWLDVTASKRVFGSGLEIAEKIRKRVREEVGITVSIGVSFNKVFAKLGSDYKKPDAITVIDQDNFKSIVYPLPAADMLFVGKKTAEALKAIGIRTIGDLASASPIMLTTKFGKMGHMLHTYASGLDDSPVLVPDDEVKSISRGITFKHDLVGREECRVGIDCLADEIGKKLRAKRLKCLTVSLTIKDVYLRTIQRQRPIRPTDIGREIAETAYSILCDEWSEEKPIRMLTVCASSLVLSEYFAEQIDIFADDKESDRIRDRKMEETVDEIRQKYGKAAIVRASAMESDIGVDKIKFK